MVLTSLSAVAEIQKLASAMTGVSLDKAIWEVLDQAFPEEAKLEMQQVLNEKVITTVWHGTRRVESDEELRQKGFCTYEPSQIAEWLNEAFELLQSKVEIGPRRKKYLEQKMQEISRQAYEPWRRQVSVSGIEEASCGWGFRNPELVHDFLWFATSGPLFNEILTELFGEPRKIKIKTKVGIRELLNPQDIHLPQLCIKSEEIVSIEPCHIQAEELSHFPRMGRVVTVPIEKIVIKQTPESAEVDHFAKRIRAGDKIRPIILVAEGNTYAVYSREWLDQEAIVEAYRKLGYNKVPARIALYSSYFPASMPVHSVQVVTSTQPEIPGMPKPIPTTITQDEYERFWKPEGWKLLAIGPTSTWRQDWGLWEAIRDIVQNALDETEAYQWGYDEQGLWISDQGRGVGVADFLLGPPKLKPEYARGRYGEGMKISTLVLVRSGYPVHITTVGKELWIVFLELDIDGVKSQQLNALYKANGSSRGTRFHLIGYKGSAYEDRFAVNIPKEDVLWSGPSLITQPKQRYNKLYPSHFPVMESSGWHEKSAGPGRIFARDIYMRDINSPYSYNLWSFNLAPDRHAPVSEGDVWLDIGRLWATVADPSLLENFLMLVKDPPAIVSEESRQVNMSSWDMGTDPVSGKTYAQIVKDNAEAWQQAWNKVMGENAIVRTSDKFDNISKHLGYEPVSLSHGVRDTLSAVIDTDKLIKDTSQEKLRETEVIPDENLDFRQAAHLKLARAIAKRAFPFSSPVSGVYAAIIPPASDRVRTAGMYGTSTNAVYISLDILFRGRDTIDTLIHELAHHRQWRQFGEAEDLTVTHSEAMTYVAANVVQSLAEGAYDEYLKEVSW